MKTVIIFDHLDTAAAHRKKLSVKVACLNDGQC